ncbi:MAG: hypothetical protein M1830_003655, partial [Pleopsidium flavum]
MAGRMSTFVGNRHGIPTPAQSSANAASDMPPPTVDSRRQAAAAQARISTPLTKLEDRPSASAFNQPERRTYSPAPPPNDKLGNIGEATQEQFESQNGNGDGFGTDLEGVDDTTTLSDIQVKDSQAEAQGRGRTFHLGRTEYYDDEEEDGNYHEAIRGNDEEGYAESMEDEEASSSEEEGSSGNGDVASEDDATVISNISKKDLAQMVAQMEAEKAGQATTLTERPKAGRAIAPLQSQNAPEPAGRRYPRASHRRAPGRAQYGVQNPNGSYPVTTAGESDMENEIDYNTLNQTHVGVDRQSRHHKGRKQRESRPQVGHVLQASQSQELPRRTKQQPHQENSSRSMKQEQSSQLHKPDLRSNHQDIRAESPQPGGNANEIDPVDDVELNLSDAKDDDKICEHHNANAQAIDGHLPEEPRANSKKRPLELDYDPETLRTMDYSDLKAQPFDSNPRAPPSVLPDNLSTASLPEKLQHVTTLPDDQRTQFFSSLTMTEWEDSGDWFVERFTDL